MTNRRMFVDYPTKVGTCLVSRAIAFLRVTDSPFTPLSASTVQLGGKALVPFSKPVWITVQLKTYYSTVEKGHCRV